MSENESTSPPPVSTGNQWVVFGPDWGRHPSVSQHLFSQFLGGDPVLWVETVGLRAPRLTWQDLRRSVQKLGDFFSGRRQSQAASVPGLTILSPATLPFTQFRLVRRFNLWQVRRAVTQMTRRLGFHRHTLVVTVPSQCDYIGHLGEGVSLYYCIDDYALWAGMNARHVRSMESRLLARVDAAVVASPRLRDHLSSFAKPVHVLSHGVDVRHFTNLGHTALPSTFEIIYFGLIDERLDLDLLQAIASQLPEVCIRLIGPVTVPVEPLHACPNIKIEGPVDYRDLPSAVASASLFILPFNVGALAMSCSPIKLKEYLACGRPVVCTALPEARLLSEVVYIAENRAAFVALVEDAFAKRLSYNAEKVAAFVANESWRFKGIQFAGIVRQTMAGKAG